MGKARRGEPAVVSLFGEAAPPARVERAPHPLAPWYDAIADLIGATAAKASAGRVLKIAKAMKDAGIAPDDVRANLFDVVRRYSPWRKVVDLTAVQCCWPWLKEPPQTIDNPSPSAFAADVLRIAGGAA